MVCGMPVRRKFLDALHLFSGQANLQPGELFVELFAFRPPIIGDTLGSL